MRQDNESNLALFVDFDNVALGARDARQRFEIHLLLQRLLEKGKIIVKRAYADWSHHKEYMADLHQAGLELIEIPSPHMSGKNSADIRLVVDAMDLCYGKEHLDTFVIVSGDSDFTPLVSKLRENNKSVIGVGMRNSSSHLLIVNCDEFIFYDDLYQERVSQQVEGLTNVPADKRKLFAFLISTIQGLMRESRGVLYSSLIKDTMQRKKPEFNEHKYGYSTFGDLLEDAMTHGLLEAVRDSRAGGTWVVSALGKNVPGLPARGGRGGASRRRNGRGRREAAATNGALEGAGGAPAGAGAAAAGAEPDPESGPTPGGESAAQERGRPEAAEAGTAAGAAPAGPGATAAGRSRSSRRRRGRRRENGTREGEAPAAPPAAPATAGGRREPAPQIESAGAGEAASSVAAAPEATPREAVKAAAAPRRRRPPRTAGKASKPAEANATAKPAEPGPAAARPAPARKKSSRAGRAAAKGESAVTEAPAAPAAPAKKAAAKKSARKKAPARGKRSAGGDKAD